MLTDARDADPDPLMRVLDLRQRLDGRPFVLQTDEGSTLKEYSFTTDEPLVGGFAAVFKVTKEGREYALKVAYRAASSVERIRNERASTEIHRDLSERQAPVPIVYHTGIVAGTPAILMSWAQGENLGRLMATLGVKRWRRDLDVRRLTGWIGAVVHAMSEIQDSNQRKLGGRYPEAFCHGDLKPGNIVISEGGTKTAPIRATILDLSEAGFGHASPDFALTVRYASPELQRRVSDPSTLVTWRSDQYAVGRMLREGLEKIKPSAKPGRFAPLFSELERLQGVANRMTAEKPEERYASWAEITDALESRTRRRLLRWSTVAVTCILVGWTLSHCTSGEAASHISVSMVGEPEKINEIATKYNIVVDASWTRDDREETPLDAKGNARIPQRFEIDQELPKGENTVEIWLESQSWFTWPWYINLLEREETIDRPKTARAFLEGVLHSKSIEHYPTVKVDFTIK